MINAKLLSATGVPTRVANYLRIDTRIDWLALGSLRKRCGRRMQPAHHPHIFPTVVPESEPGTEELQSCPNSSTVGVVFHCLHYFRKRLRFFLCLSLFSIE